MEMRVHQLARELKVPSARILQFLKTRDIFVKSASSRLDASAVALLRAELASPAVPGIGDLAAPTIRVHELAHELTIPTKELMAHLRLRGIRVRSAASRLGQSAADLLRAEFSVGTIAEDVPPKHAEEFWQVESGLTGSPYSIPDEQRAYIEDDLLPRVEALHYQAASARQRLNQTGLRAIGRINRTSEIYESNRIEGLGPDLATTDAVLKDYALDRSVGAAVAQDAIQRCIDAEPKIRDVVGLGAAKVLAELFVNDAGHPLTESDVRQLHGLIMVGDSCGGAYKQYINSISGSDHVPPTPMDTPLQMRDLMSWLSTSELSPLWRATVAHAWLTHIHPFHDGNGRIARLLANLILIRAQLPPLIVRATSDRGRYIDALNTSDDGGNILPLVRVFRRIVSRAVRDLEQPAFAQRLFDAEVERRFLPLFERWQTSLNELMTETASRLLLHRMELRPIGEIDNTTFEQIQASYGRNAWIAKVKVQGKQQDLLLHVASSSFRSGRRLERDERAPSIFVSFRNPRPLAAHSYVAVGHDQHDYEFTPIVDTGTVLVRVRGNAKKLRTADAAEAIANHLARIAEQLLRT